MQFKIKKFLIINFFITLLLTQNNLYSSSGGDYIKDYGVISLMYHRFEENKYPSTNIKILDFKKKLEIINNKNIKFINAKNFGVLFEYCYSEEKVTVLTINEIGNEEVCLN